MWICEQATPNSAMVISSTFENNDLLLPSSLIKEEEAENSNRFAFEACIITVRVFPTVKELLVIVMDPLANLSVNFDYPHMPSPC